MLTRISITFGGIMQLLFMYCRFRLLPLVTVFKAIKIGFMTKSRKFC